MPPGSHSAHASYWRVLNRSVTNYTPLQFNYRIENLTPTPDGGLWFSVGSSIERIEANGNMTQYVMPHDLWRVSGIAEVGDNVWFSAGQSGNVGRIDAQRYLTFIQVVPRRFFPDIHDLVVDDRGEMWFVDAGRRSIGYRTSSGRVVEHPLPDGAWPNRMRQCIGRLWVTGDSPRLSRLGVVDSSFRVRWYATEIPTQAMISGMTCDGHGYLWLTLNNRFRSTTQYVARIDRHEGLKLFAIPVGWAGDIASDNNGGAWISVAISPGGDPGLVHIEKGGMSQTYPLPTLSYTPGAIAVGPRGAIWLSIENGNSPLSIACLQTI